MKFSLIRRYLCFTKQPCLYGDAHDHTPANDDDDADDDAYDDDDEYHDKIMMNMCSS